MAINMNLRLKKMRKLLLEQAMIKAVDQDNDYVLCLLKGINLNNFSQADGDMLNDYLGLPAGTMIEV